MNVNPWLPPDELAEPLLDIVLAAEDEALGVMRPALEQGYDEGRAALEDMGLAIGAVLSAEAIRRAWREARDAAAGQATEHWIREAARAGIASQVTNPRPPELALDQWEDESVGYYDRIARGTEAEARGAMDASEEAGVAAAVLLADWEEQGVPTVNGRMRGRGGLISSDRLWTLAALIAAAQQRDAGIRAFIWTSMQDSRVRPLHRALHGRVYKWAEPPSEGYPGEPVNCRCWAVGITVREGEDPEDA